MSVDQIRCECVDQIRGECVEQIRGECVVQEVSVYKLEVSVFKLGGECVV